MYTDEFINIKTSNFDGPLALLLLLIQKEDMRIEDIDIRVITNQYIKYLRALEKYNFNMAGEYLYMAATLLHIKSKNCLNEDEIQIEEELLPKNIPISKEELVLRLRKLERYQLFAKKIWQMKKLGEDYFIRPKFKKGPLVTGVANNKDVNEIVRLYTSFKKRERVKNLVILKERVSLKDKMKFLSSKLTKNSSTDLWRLFEQEERNYEDFEISENIVVTVLTLLELARLKKIKLYQNKAFENIYIKVVNDVKENDIEILDL